MVTTWLVNGHSILWNGQSNHAIPGHLSLHFKVFITDSVQWYNIQHCFQKFSNNITHIHLHCTCNNNVDYTLGLVGCKCFLDLYCPVHMRKESKWTGKVGGGACLAQNCWVTNDLCTALNLFLGGWRKSEGGRRKIIRSVADTCRGRHAFIAPQCIAFAPIEALSK